MKLPETTRLMILTLVGVIAVIWAGCAASDARARKPAATQVSAPPAQQVSAPAVQQDQAQKPVKLRYYGGPKSPMYPG
jgi:hypothetical protein